MQSVKSKTSLLSKNKGIYQRFEFMGVIKLTKEIYL